MWRMEMFRKHSSSLLVIIAGLLSCIATADGQSPRIYSLCLFSTPAVVRVNTTYDPFIIQSPNYPSSSYPNNLDCALTFQSGAEPLVLSFEYRVFNLEAAGNCVYDYLCVVGVKFCGNWATGRMFQRIVPAQSTSTVRFHTDGSVTLNGFYIIVTSQPVVPIDQVEGSGWEQNGITYVPATYYPGMPYTDGCRGSLSVDNSNVNYTYGDVGNATREETRTTTENTTTTTAETPVEGTVNATLTPTQRDSYYFCNNGQSSFIIDINSGSSPFLIRSPNYGQAPYDNNQYCSLVIRSGAEPLVLSLRINDFQVETQASCGYDYLCVHGIKFCGDWLGGYAFNYILPANRLFTTTFKTDYSGIQRGFEIEVSQVQARTNETVRQPSGVVCSSATSLSYTLDEYQPGYPYTDSCVSNSLVTPSTSTTRVTPTTSTTQETSTPSTARVTNSSSTNSVTNSSSTSSVTNSSSTSPAFTQQGPYYFCNGQSSIIIDINSGSSPFLIRSPNYGQASYDNNQYCSIVIRSSAEPLVLSLRINDFQVETQASCGYDYLCVHGIKFCGDWLRGYAFDYILPANSLFTTIFKTDYSRIYRGFEIEISQVQARTNETVRQPTGVVGSSSATFSYTLEAYRPGYPYSDICVTTTPVNSTTSSTPVNSTTSSTPVNSTTSSTPVNSTTSSTPVNSTTSTSRGTPAWSTSASSPVVPPSDQTICHSASQVQDLYVVLTNAIADLMRARSLLYPRK